MGALLRWLSYGVRALQLKASVERGIHGIRCLSFMPDAESERIFERLSDALVVMKNHDPRRFGRVCGELRFIWVWHLDNGYRAQFNPRLTACELEVAYVLDPAVPAEFLASTILHESTHARLWRIGCRYQPEHRHRIEMLCRREELRFAQRLPDDKGLRERLNEAIAVPEDSFSERSLGEHQLRGQLAALERIDAPGWVRYLLRRLVERRLASLTRAA